MGMYCDVYENLRLLNTRIDWTDERNTALVLQLTVLSTVIAILGYWFIPWRMVIMTMGLLAFLANTAVGLATQTLFIKYAQSNAIFVFSGLQRMLGDRLKSIIGGDTATEGTPSTTVLIEVVENQRWWAGLNWIPHLLRNERASWSSLDGQLASKPMSEMLDPSEAIHMGMGVSAATNGDLPRRLPSDLSTLAWRWVPGSTWTLDQTWVTASNKQALVDEEGWVYSDHDWTLTKKKRALLTRRRRWVRPAYVADVTGK